MSLKVTAKNARVEYLTKGNSNLLTATQGILYTPKTPVKLGQVTRDAVAGLSPQEAFERRYKGSKSNISEDMVAEDIFVFDKIHGSDFAYDDAIRSLAHKLYQAKKIPFDALTPDYQKDGYNSEALISYKSRTHRRIMIKVMKQYFGIANYWDTRRAIEWWWEQENEVNEIAGKLVSKGLCLYAAYTGRGKTTISIGVASKMFPKGGLVLVTTPIRDTRNGFEEKIEDYYFGEDRSRKITFIDNTAFAKTTVKELRQRADAGELIFVVLTVQDVRYKDQQSSDLDKLRSKYNALAGHLDMWIRDERHLQYEAELTSRRLGNLAAKYELDLTATPYNVLDKYESDQIVARTLIWGLRNREHTKLPKIYIDAIATPFEEIDARLSAIYSTEEGFDPRKLVVRKNGNFVLQSALISLAEQFYLSILSKNKNKLSISDDPDLSMVSRRCGMWVLPEGQNGDGVAEYIPALAKMLNANMNGKVFFASSYWIEDQSKSEGITIDAYVKRLLSNHKTVIILTCGKFTTGTDITPLGHIVLMDNMTSIANFEQLLGRMERIYPGKESVKLYTIMPGHSVKVILGSLARESAALTGTVETEMLDCIPFQEYDSGKARKVDIAEILEATQEWFRGRVKERLPIISLGRELSTMDLSSLKGLDLSKFKAKVYKSELTDKNGAKVKTRLNAEGKAMSAKEANLVAKTIAMMQTVMQELQWVSYKANCYDYEKLLTTNTDITEMFGDELIGSLYQIISSNPNVSRMIRDWLINKQQAYASLLLEEVMDDIFLNSDYKLRMGLVYLPLSAARHIVNDEHVNNVKRILVMNARNGSIVLALREKFPEAEIVCAEQYTQFTSYLNTRFGVQVVGNINTVDDIYKIPRIESFDHIFNEPPVNRRGESRTYILFNKAFLELPQKPVVISLLPDKTGSTAADIVKHNERIAKHNLTVIYNLNDYYPEIGGYTKKGDHICAISSLRQVNEIKPQIPLSEKLEKLSLPFSERKRIEAIVGSEELAHVDESKTGIKIVLKVAKERGKPNPHVVYKTVPAKVALAVRRKTDAPYLVISNRRARNGKLNVAIIRNTQNTRWSRWVFAYPARSKVDALKLAKWLVSKTVRECIMKMVELRDKGDAAKKTNSDTPTVTKEMLIKLPYYR